MFSIKNRIVFITGASSGIGQATAEILASSGGHIIIAARRLERLQAMQETLEQRYDCQILPLKLDVRDHQAVQQAITNLPANWQSIDILVNNAGLACSSDKIQDADPQNWDIMIDTNIRGLLSVTHAVLPGMLARRQGHIVNVSSIAGHGQYTGGNVYSATKHAVRSLTKSLRIDLLGSGIRISEIAPGAVQTEFSEVRWQDKARADAFYQEFQALQACDIADAIAYCVTRPPHVDVAEMVIYPNCQASMNHIIKNGVIINA